MQCAKPVEESKVYVDIISFCTGQHHSERLQVLEAVTVTVLFTRSNPRISKMSSELTSWSIGNIIVLLLIDDLAHLLRRHISTTTLVCEEP